MKRASAVSIALLVSGVAAACRSSEDAAPASPCVAFAKAGAPSLRIADVVATKRASPFVALVSGAGRSYALDREGGFGLLGAGRAIATGASDVAVGRTAAGVRAFAARWTTTGAVASLALVRFTSADDGLTFDEASAKTLFEVSGVRGVAEATSLAVGPDGLLYVAIGDAFPAELAKASRLGKILRLDVARDDAMPEIWASGVHEPRGLDVDVGGDVWLTDRTKTDDGIVLRVSRGSAEVLAPVLVFTSADQRPTAAGGHIHRGPNAPSLVGSYVYPAGNGRLGVVAPYGPSGPPQATLLELGDPWRGPLGRGERGELTVLTDAGVGAVIDAAARPAPTSLLATRCWDPLEPSGQPSGVIAYDVTTPLWSDGATKERFVALPAGGRVAARADGDLTFPVGTVAATRTRGTMRRPTPSSSWATASRSYRAGRAGTSRARATARRATRLPPATRSASRRGSCSVVVTRSRSSSDACQHRSTTRRSRGSSPSRRRRRPPVNSARAAICTRTARAVIARGARPGSRWSSTCASIRRSPPRGCAVRRTRAISASTRRA